MKRAKYSIKKSIKKGLATLLSVCLIVSGVQTPVYAAEASIPTESTATVSGLVNKKVVLDLLSDDLRDAALTAIRENRLFDAGDYLGATSDSKKAIKEYEAFFNRNPGLYVVEVPDSVKDILSSEAESELRIFVQKDEKKAKVDLEDENAADESVLSRDVNFRYGTEDDIILYEPSSQIDTLVNGGEDAYYRDPEQDTADNSDYQLTGKEKITFMFINASDGAVRFTLKVDGVKYDSVEVCGRTAALKRVLAQAGVKKTEETTAAVVQTTQAVETTQAPELVNMEAGPTGTEELTQPGEENIQEGIADTSEIITPEDNENDSTEISNPVTAEQEAGAGESTDIENGADTEDNNQGYIEADTNTSQQELTENNAAEQTNDDTAVVTDDDSAELTNNDAAEVTDNDTAEISDTEDNANVENEDGAQAQIEDIEDNEDSITDQISDAVQDAVDNVSNIILGRMVVYAEVIGEGYVFEEEQQDPETEEEEKNEDIAAEAGNTEGNDNDAADKQEIQADLDDNNGAAEGGQQGGQEYGQEEGRQDGQEYGQEEGQQDGQEIGQQGGQEIGQQGEGLGTETLEQNEGSGAEIAGQNEAGSGNESNVTIVDILTEDNQEEGVQNDTTSTEISTGDVPETVIGGTIPEGQMTLEDLTGMMAEPETTAAAEIQKPETTVKMPVASPSEVEETKGEYDEFAKALIEEVKQAVLEDKDAAKEQIKVAKIVQYSIGSLGKIHYLTEIDGYTVEVFASQDAFGGFKPKLEVKRLYKPEENEGNGDVPTDAQIAELKANGIYDNSLLLDICFKNDAGDEVEPNGNVNVRMTLNDEELLKKIDASSLEVHHIKDDNSTLKTEKVAEKEEVKILDGNDVQISDSDLEANAEAIAAGGEAEVEVASAVAEFEVESFSLFAITWTKSNYTQLKANVRVHYVDESGNPVILNNNYETYNEYGTILELADVSSNSKTVLLKNWEGGVTGYDYIGAKLDSYNSSKNIDSVTSETSGQDRVVFKLGVNDNGTGGQVIDSSIVNNPTRSDNGICTQDGHFLYYYNMSDGVAPFKISENVYRNVDKITNRFELLEDRDLDDVTSDGYYYVFEKYSNKYARYIRYETIDRYDPVTRDIYLIYRKHTYPVGGSDDEEDLDPDDYESLINREKSLTQNDDGTYKLTLSVKGTRSESEERKPVNVVFILDTSNSMAYGHNGERQNVPLAEQRITTAKIASRAMVEELLELNKDDDGNYTGNTVQMTFITFNKTAKIQTKKATNNPNDIYPLINKATLAQGTNWEDALIKANSFDFGDDDPVHIIFVSDGAPTFRYSRNGFTADGGSEGQWGGGDNYSTESKAQAQWAAVRAAHDIKVANKTLYTIGAFPVLNDDGIDELEQLHELLFDNDKNNYYSATDLDSLNDAFSDICDKISTAVGFTEVKIADGITDLTASSDIRGSVKDYTYEIRDRSGRIVNDADVLDALENSANYDSTRKAVVWNFPSHITVDGKQIRFVLQNGYTYSVSFTVWPEQETYDTLADLENMYGANPSAPTFSQVNENEWEYNQDTNYFFDGTVYRYKTNTFTELSYKIVKSTDGNYGEPSESSGLYTIPLSEDSLKGMSLASSRVGIEKVWRFYDINQKNSLPASVTLDLMKKEVGESDYKEYINDITISKPNPMDEPTKPEGKDYYEVSWPGSSKYIAPGILVKHKDGGDNHGFDELWEQGEIHRIGDYYMLETGHDYEFFEQQDSNSGFSLIEDVIYHPMVVDGVLKKVEFERENGEIVDVTNITEIGEDLTKLTAINVMENDELTVSKMYTGNMAEPHTTAFELYLYKVNDDGTTTPASYDETYIKGLSTEDHDNANLDISKQSDGGFKFTIDMKDNTDMSDMNLNAYDDVTIVLPAGVTYEVKELDPGSGYVTYSATTKDNIIADANKKSSSGQKKLGEVHTIYFANKKDEITPTGYADNVYPFAVLALAGFAAMFFLACDFEKKRLFED